MFTTDSYLWTIMETAEDDYPRLAFADWLENQGEITHAEFIRLQCQLAENPADDDRWKREKDRMEVLWKMLREQWKDRVQELSLPPFQLSHFHRGFLNRPVTLEIEDRELWLRAEHRW